MVFVVYCVYLVIISYVFVCACSVVDVCGFIICMVSQSLGCCSTLLPLYMYIFIFLRKDLYLTI